MDQDARMVDDALLSDWPLPVHDGDKEERGRLLLVAGSRETPGAVLLAATAAFRAGAGKLTIATGAGIAQAVAMAIPESRVIELPETASGGIAPAAVDRVGAIAPRYDAVLIGPGMQDEAAACALVLALLPRLDQARVILDAAAMNVVRRQLQAVDSSHHAQQKYIASFDAPVLLTPHAGEMAHLAALDKDSVLADPHTVALQAARRWNALVALKGVRTFIAAPNGQIWQHQGGNVGLAVSGSGDVLAGIIAGLAARGASLEQACAWGVALHARAGERLAQRYGTLGYLASELAAEVPPLMHSLANR
jgi:ADP-dependent NAD(P)H-hydrate dehydratase